jgi:hypothetical protein
LERIFRPTELDWETSVQVLSSETGAQYLSEGLPLTGLVYDEKGGREKIEISVGTGAGQHQTHNIFDPKFAAYETLEDKKQFILDIETENGDKTIVKFKEPLPAVVNRSENEAVTMVSPSA